MVRSGVSAPARRLAWMLGSLLVAGATAARAQTTYQWPAAPPCDGTLQQCIDAAASGDIVEIVTNDPIPESPEIDGKSLTLRAGAGFSPVFASPNSVSAFGSDEDQVIVIEGLTLANGQITAVHGGSGLFDVTIRNNVIQDTFTTGAAIAIRSGNTRPPYGEVRFHISDNQITVPDFAAGDQVSAISVSGLQEPGPASGVIQRNTIVQTGDSTQNAVIDIANGLVEMDVDVLANHITGNGFNEGIGIFQFAAGGSVTSRIVNNLVSGQSNVSGQPGGISLSVTAGSGTFTVLNNTVAGNESGIVVAGSGAVTGSLANNIVANNTGTGISIAPALEAGFTNRHNLVFGNGSDSFTPGPGTLFVDPLFAGPSDFHLQDGSPARNSGDSSVVPGDITTDLDGLPRIVAPAVDMGAFESQGLAAAEVPSAGRLGLAALAVALAGIAAALLRR